METIEFGGQEIHIHRKPRLRGLSLSVYPDGRIVLKVAKTTSTRVLQDFIHSRESWLNKAIGESARYREANPPKRFENGETFPFLGTNFTLEINQCPRLNLKFAGNTIQFYRPEDCSQEQCISLLKKCYEEAGKRILTRRVEHWSEEMDLQPKEVKFPRAKNYLGKLLTRQSYFSQLETCSSTDLGS